jgi:oxygen-independent coproporphyrinogen-3 oxidase
LTEKPVIRELHLGGGTPTFLEPESLKTLMEGILKNVDIHPEFEFSFEGHPNNTTRSQLKLLYNFGFRRVSFGVQDLSLRVQKAINRIQPIEVLQQVTIAAKKIGYESVNFDLVYGLPFQNEKNIRDTILKTIDLRPDRYAYYSYAHVPWKSPGQRAYSEKDLPRDSEKRRLYETGRELLIQNGYYDIGMDHFALPEDSLYQSWIKKRLHRNFMGYTTTSTDLLIGLGTSSISDAKYAYAQNAKVVEEYQDSVSKSGLSLIRGYLLNEEDRQIRRQILDISCKGKVELTEKDLKNPELMIQLNEMEDEGLIFRIGHEVSVTNKGMTFLRNICALFDKNMDKKSNSNLPVYSKSI